MKPRIQTFSSCLLAVLLVCSSTSLRASPTSPRAAANQVLVLAPVVINPDPAFAWLAPAIQQSFVADLSRRLANGVMSSPHSAATQDEAMKWANQSHAQRVITGAIQFVGDQIRYTGLIVETKSGRALVTLKVTGRLNDLFEMEDQLSAQACRALVDRPAKSASVPITIAASGPLRASYATADSQAGLEYARPYTNNRFQVEQDRYFYNGAYYGYGCYYWWGYPGTYWVWGWSAYPTASPGWAW